jgi:RNA ligase (TIGR02306 family)
VEVQTTSLSTQLWEEMSTTKITCERVNEVENHPNADRLDVIQVLGYKVVTGRDQFKVGDPAIYFPPDILIPEATAEELGVKKYLKHAVYPGDTEKSQCRVGAARLRSVPSHGFVIGPVENAGAYGVDLTVRYGGVKYEPPVRVGAGDAMPELAAFHEYTSIENIQRCPFAIPRGEPVRYTEKIHGTNCRLGLVRGDDGDWIFAAGSHKIRRKEDDGHQSLYWQPMDANMMNMLTQLCDEQHNVVVFGEVFGPGVQDMDYGQPVHAFRVFDITIDGVYQDWNEIVQVTDHFEIQTVPLLALGEFSPEDMENYTYGRTTLADRGQIRSKFKEREGVVATPLREQFSDALGGRMIVKSISADYRDRKGAQDNE